LPAKTIFASPVYTMENKRFFPPSGKNLPTLRLVPDPDPKNQVFK